MNVFSEAGKMLIILLMLIGGAPGSTAGGMKVTTFGVIFLSVRSVLLREKDTNFHNRRIEESVIRNAVCICMMYLSLFLMAGCIISRIEGLPLLTCLFESASAVGTVGLTLGITPSLSIASKLILILLMFLGRVGGLTMVYAVIPQIRHGNARRITERVTVG
jgi:trk system potassium uptake protein TrkH